MHIHDWSDVLSDRFNDTLTPPTVNAEVAYNLLGLKAYRQWKDLSKVGLPLALCYRKKLQY